MSKEEDKLYKNTEDLSDVVDGVQDFSLSSFLSSEEVEESSNEIQGETP